MQKPIVLAEIGTSHGGDLGKARELIAAASEAGADAAKFQLVYAEEILHPNSGFVDLPGGRIPLFERFKALERPLEFYAALKEETEARGMWFVCSPFGIRSAGILHQMGTKVFKIASPELNHYPLLEEVSSYHVPVLMSTGVSTLGDIERAIATFQDHKPGMDVKSPLKTPFSPLTLLHCITAYPAPEEEYNLSLLPNLEGIFGLPVGVSDHSKDPVLVPVLAVLQGAKVIEKHFTLDPKGSGLDDPIALDPKTFQTMVMEVRSAFLEIRAGRRTHVIEALEAKYGKEKVWKVLGDGVKRLAPSEMNNYRTTNRSIHAITDLRSGELLTEKNCALLRTEKNLKPGLSPEFWRVVLGKRLVRDVNAGEGIQWEDLLT
ncbi:MAG: N-acetylneuraminate synthase family protein [Spirochaetes bacterium]|nr:N-acetylneuraminate synthase family protein [Spirochaetota bacterium]